MNSGLQVVLVCGGACCGLFDAVGRPDPAPDGAAAAEGRLVGGALLRHVVDGRTAVDTPETSINVVQGRDGG